MRCTQFNSYDFKQFQNHDYQTGTKVAHDEEAEQVFSRKDRKAYRVEVLGGKQRTEAKRGNARGKKSQMGKEVQTRCKAKRS